jgi:putative endonuclease
MVYLYFLRCAGDGLYIGITRDLKRRYEEHKRGEDGAKYTKGHAPERIVFVASFDTWTEAARLEKKLKVYTRDRKEYLI